MHSTKCTCVQYYRSAVLFVCFDLAAWISRRFFFSGVHLIYNNTAILTISTDQRLNMWAIKDNGDNSLSLQMKDAAFVDVPDPSTMDIVEYRYV